MEASYWAGSRTSRRGFLSEMGAAAGALVLAPAIAACSGRGTKQISGAASVEATSKPVKGGTLTSSMPGGDISNLDYAFVVEQNSGVIIANCVEPLLTVDTKGQPAGLLATAWEQPDDHTYLFRLRQGVKFQDGTDFNADAVEYSLNRIRTDKVASAYSLLLYIDKIEKPDSGTVKLTLSSPLAPFLYSLAIHAGRVISPAIGEKYGKDRLKLDLTGAGTGPFKFVEWKKDDHITMVRNENYWGKDASGTQLPYLDKLIYRVIPDGNVALASLRSGELDVLGLGLGTAGPPKDIASVKADPSLSYRDRPSTNFSNLVFNEAKEPFGSRELRQAISYAVDRAAITHAVFFDTASPHDVIFTPAIWTYDPDYHPYLKRDVGKAKQLLAQAGKPNGIAFTLLGNGGPPVIQATAELIKDQLKEAGVEMTIQLLDGSRVNASLNRGEHQAASLGSIGSLDPSTWVNPFFSTTGALNSWTHYNNPEVDRLLEQGRTTLDPAARKPIYQQAQRLIIDDAALCVLYSAASAALSTKRVHNVPLGPTPYEGASQVWKTA